MEGSYTAHAVYGYFMNGGSLAGSSAWGAGRSPEARAALPSATDKEVEALRAVALDGVTDTVRGGGHRGAHAGGQGRRADLQVHRDVRGDDARSTRA